MDGMQAAQLVVGVGMVTIGAANLIWTSIVAVRSRKIETLESDLKFATGQIIDQKLGLIVHRLDDHEKRLATGHGHFSNVDQKIQQLALADRELKLEVLQAINELRDKVVTMEDLKRWEEKRS